MAVAGAQPAEGAGAALLGDKVIHLLHESFIGEDLRVLFEAGEAVRQIKDAGRRSEGGQVAAGEDGHMDFSRTQLLHVGLFIAHGAADEFLNLNFAAGFLFDNFLKLVDGSDMLAAVRVGSGRTDGHCFVLDGVRGSDAAKRESHGTHKSD